MKPCIRSVVCRLVFGLMLSFAAVSTVVAIDVVPLERTLVDFEDPAGVRLAPNRAQGAIVKSADGGSALEVTTDADADFPSLRIEPQAGVLDLTGFESVAVDVRNPQALPVRVLLSVNSPGADGERGCSVASLSLGAGEKGTLIVPLGLWHGQPRPFDPAVTVSFDVLLDRPGRSHKFTVDNLRAVRRERFELEAAMTEPFFQTLKPQFGRGINLGNALDAPREGDWGVTLQADYFRAIKAAGFDSVRLPVKWSAHAQLDVPYKIDALFFDRIDWAVEQALSNGLSIVMNVHHYEEMDSQPDRHRARFVALWRQIADRYRDRPPGLAFELLNEPHDQLTAAKWNSILAEALAEVRKTNPTRTVVIGPTAWNGISELKSLELPEADRNLVVTVHYYSPFEFTHQGAPWLNPQPKAGVKWTGTEREREAVIRDLDTAALWSLKHQRPIYLGEFGAYSAADLESRARWTKFIADKAATRRLGTAYWEFCSGFGAYDPERREWIEPLRAALIPQQAK